MTGRDLEKRFLEITGFEKSRSTKRGDAIAHVDGEQHYLEVKLCAGGTMNQVRAIRFIPVAAFDGEHWYVIPANRIVLAAAVRRRGQHTEAPWESLALPISEFETYRVSDERDLARQMFSAVREDRTRDDLRQIMDSLRSGLRWLVEDTRRFVAEAGPTRTDSGLPLFSQNHRTETR